MVQVTWLGEPGGPDKTEWNGMHFEKGKAVEVADEEMLRKARANRFYKVAGDKSPTVEDNPDPVPQAGRVDDLPENIAFAPQEQLTARRQDSIAKNEADEEAEKKRGPGRPSNADKAAADKKKADDKANADRLAEQKAAADRAKADAEPRFPDRK